MRQLARLVIVPLLALAGCDATSSGDRPFLTRTFQTPDGQTAHYVLFVPPNRDPDEKLPVILFLNGWGENGNDGLRQISNNFGGDMWRMRGWFPFLAVCPQCTYNAEWTPGSPNEQLALDVLDAAIREFNGDPDRVTITGASTGGTGALNIALANRDQFAAVVPISSPIHLDPVKLAESRLPVWSFYNGGDSPTLVEAARNARLRHLKFGTSPRVTEFDLAGHNAWDPAYSSPALYRWLLQQKRQPSEPFNHFQFLQPQQLLDQWREGAPGWKIDGEDLVSLPGESSKTLISPRMPGNWAVHFDLQISAGSPGLVKLIGEEGNATELRLPLGDDGIGELLDPKGSSLRVDPAAQRALRSGWNEVRMESLNGRLSLLLNGWPAIESLPSPDEGSPVRVAFDSGPDSKEQRIRYVRMSTPNGDEALP
jgi:pimeloyl-ACP methyl ester carboxylesterase